MKVVRACNGWLLKGVEAILILLILAIVVMGFGQVVLRKLFDKGFSEVNVILQFSVLWVAFLGATLATHRQKHIKIDVLTPVFPDRAKPWLLAAVNLAGLGLCAVLFRGAWSYFRQFAQGEWDVASNPVWYASLVVGFGLVGLEFLICLLELVFSAKTGAEQPGGADKPGATTGQSPMGAAPEGADSQPQPAAQEAGK
jgi:TRAP-type C4-dicarboxylate transport system permease small subunit